MQQVTMIHLPVEKACYMASSVDGTVAPTVLKEALETVSKLELPPQLDSLVSLAIYSRTLYLILININVFHSISRKLLKQVKA